MGQTTKKIAILHRYPEHRIRETNAAFPHISPYADVLTFKSFDRAGGFNKLLKSIAWIFYAPLLVIGRGYSTIYCDDSMPFYPILLRLVCPQARIVLRLGDFHLMYYTSGFIYSILHWFEVLGWQCSDEILAISEAMADAVGKEWKRRPVVILDPIDEANFRMNGLKPHGTVMFHGVLTRNKNIDILLEAAHRLPRTNFVIIGDGPDRKRLERKAPDNVFFKGWVPFSAIASYISTCSIGVALRSQNPGNDYVLTSPFLQYGIMGKPCIVTKRKVFGDYPWQFSTVDELVRMIIELKHPNREGQKLRERILIHHNAKHIAKKIWDYL